MENVNYPAIPLLPPSPDELFSLKAELCTEIENSVHLFQEIEEEVQHFFYKSNEPFSETKLAKPSCKFPCSQLDVEEFSKKLHDKILEVQTQKKIVVEKAEKLFFPQESENLHGELEKDLEKFKDQPNLFNLLCKYKEIFGPLPPPSLGCPLVQMDVELKEEWVGKPLRQRCWPMPVVDQEEICRPKN